MFDATDEVYGTYWALLGERTFQWNSLWIGLSIGAYGVCQALVLGFRFEKLTETSAK